MPNLSHRSARMVGVTPVIARIVHHDQRASLASNFSRIHNNSVKDAKSASNPYSRNSVKSTTEIRPATNMALSRAFLIELGLPLLLEPEPKV
jgi:hypothetical protein